VEHLDIVPIYMSGQQRLLQRLAWRLESTFQTTVRWRVPTFDPEVAYDISRGQHNSTILLKLLLEEVEDTSTKVLGVTGVDLFIPVLTYVFGEAQLVGTVAVVSSHRLRAEAYGLETDQKLLIQRLEKEAVHELGHTFGLIHCAESACVMHPSTYVEQIDLKSVEFCTDCLGSVRADRSCQAINP